MARRSPQTQAKRQREFDKAQKRRDKAEKRALRKAQKTDDSGSLDVAGEIAGTDTAAPIGVSTDGETPGSAGANTTSPDGSPEPSRG